MVVVAEGRNRTKNDEAGRRGERMNASYGTRLKERHNKNGINNEKRKVSSS